MKSLLNTIAAVIFLPLLAVSAHAQNGRLRDYVAFLETHTQTPVDYIISLYENHDLVVLSERLHAEITQYEFIIELLSQPRFNEQAGTVYFEIGGSHLTPVVDEFLFSTGLSEEEIEREVLKITRLAHWRPFWNAYTFHILLRELYKINQRLTSENKLRLVFCDYPLDWTEVLDSDHPDIRKIHHDDVLFNDERDITISRTIIEDFDRVTEGSPRKKALAILNTVHAVKAPGNIKTERTWATMFLQEHYGERLANVYINMANPGIDETDVAADLVDGGRWDAAFSIKGNKSVGFDFAGSPFGETMMYEDPDLTALRGTPIKEIFTGMVFHHPLEEQRLVYGYVNNISDDFIDEFIRRSEIWGWPTEAETLKEAFNTQTTMSYPDLEEYMSIINDQVEEYRGH